MQKDGKPARKIYLQKNVLQAAQERISWLFSNFKEVVVSVSGGKDSSVAFELAWRHAQELGREVHVFFLDQEAEYQSTIAIVRSIYDRPGVIPHWWQSPFKTTNATSYEEPLLYAWGEGEEWMREKESDSFQAKVPLKEHEQNRDTFYHMVEYAEAQWGESTALLIGLRSEESLNRYGAVTRNPGIENVKWTSKSSGKAIKCYPIYDWTFEDIWTYIGNESIPYNRVYDWMYVKGFNIPEMRVSNLVHEKAFRCLSTLHEFEPDTYDRLLKRLKGIHVAARYADEQTVFSAKKLPQAFENWLDYRDFLLSTLPREVRSPPMLHLSGRSPNHKVFHKSRLADLPNVSISECDQ
ncbi:MAG: phosphoadenosine phosphosulfate reductase family protein [Timaviella obliquedivisa GSE-PSE-MK23-08B]|nr:phosphoadenosine phosphosulfate reductase family protein [Timaviella obliquedivisa GSE-PSE-MK23-08B]